MLLDATFYLLGVMYLCLALVTGLQLWRISRSYSPWTTQKMIHILMLIGLSVRFVFMMMASNYWHSDEGMVTNEDSNILFFILDQTPSVIYFSIYTLLVLFWAEVYYVSCDQIQIFVLYVKPIAILCNLVVYLFQIAIWIVRAVYWGSTGYYVSKAYAIAMAAVFMLIASAFLYYGRQAYFELQVVPVELQIRSQKLQELGLTTGICTSCFILRACILLYVAAKPILLTARLAFLAPFFYFTMLELLPAAIVLYYHRTMPLSKPSATLWCQLSQMDDDEGLLGSALLDDDDVMVL